MGQKVSVANVARRARAWATIDGMARTAPPHASCTASRIVARSRIEIRSASRACSTRCTPPVVICDGVPPPTATMRRADPDWRDRAEDDRLRSLQRHRRTLMTNQEAAEAAYALFKTLDRYFADVI